MFGRIRELELALTEYVYKFGMTPRARAALSGQTAGIGSSDRLTDYPVTVSVREPDHTDRDLAYIFGWLDENLAGHHGRHCYELDGVPMVTFCFRTLDETNVFFSAFPNLELVQSSKERRRLDGSTS